MKIKKIYAVVGIGLGLALSTSVGANASTSDNGLYIQQGWGASTGVWVTNTHITYAVGDSVTLQNSNVGLNYTTSVIAVSPGAFQIEDNPSLRTFDWSTYPPLTVVDNGAPAPSPSPSGGSGGSANLSSVVSSVVDPVKGFITNNLLGWTIGLVVLSLGIRLGFKTVRKFAKI